VDESPQVIILDAGTGIRELGLDLMKKHERMKLTVLLSHFHWDHIQGIPFFKPLYSEETECTFIGSDMVHSNIEHCLLRAIGPPFFPVTFDAFKAAVRFVDVGEGPLKIGPVSVNLIPVHHPGGAVAWKITCRGRSLVYMTDNEISLAAPSERYQDLLTFSHGADVLIHDAQYTPEEYAMKKGWGHSSCTAAVRYAMDCGARWLVLFHHDPGHDDATLDGMVARCREMLVAEGSPAVECVGGREGLEMEV